MGERSLIIQAIVAVFIVICATAVAVVPSVSAADQIIPGDALIGLYSATLGYIFGAGQFVARLNGSHGNGGTVDVERGDPGARTKPTVP